MSNYLNIVGQPEAAVGTSDREGHGQAQRELRVAHRRPDSRGLVGAHRLSVRLDPAREEQRGGRRHRSRNGVGQAALHERGRLRAWRLVRPDEHRGRHRLH